MIAVCMRYSHDEDEAKDIVQLGFIKVFSKMEMFNSEGSLKAWIHRIMVRTAIDHYRKLQREGHHLRWEDCEDEPQDAEIEGKIAADDIMLLIQQLPDMQRAVFNLFAIEGYSHKEIATLLNTTEGTSKWHLYEARKALKELLEALYAPAPRTYVA